MYKKLAKTSHVFEILIDLKIALALGKAFRFCAVMSKIAREVERVRHARLAALVFARGSFLCVFLRQKGGNRFF
jgi:hypothetical protein